MFILKIMSQKVDQSVDNDYQHKNIRKLEWWFVKRKVQKLEIKDIIHFNLVWSNTIFCD
jgi:hypothetical protein